MRWMLLVCARALAPAHRGAWRGGARLGEAYMSDVQRQTMSGLESGSLRPVTISVDEGLRTRLRLTSRQRKLRLFLEAGADELALRELIGQHVPQLKRAQYDFGVPDVSSQLKTLFAADAAFNTTKGLKFTVVATDDGRSVDAGAARSSSTAVGATAYQMVSWYAFFSRPLSLVAEGDLPSGVDAACSELEGSWAELGVLGRAYVAPEGVNAQLAVPVETLRQFEVLHAARAADWIASGLLSKVPPLNPDVILSKGDFDATKPFRALHVRPREQVVADGLLDDAAARDAALNFEDAGYEATPAEWHTLLGGDFSAKSGAKAPLVLDCRNHYESAVGTFSGSTPLGTETFKETYDKIDALLKDRPKDENVMMFCTGGIRCVKVGSYVKQVLGFANVTRLSGGVVNYTRFLAGDAEADERERAWRLSKVSQFRGVNFVFDERMGQRVTNDAATVDANVPLDPRAAEALSRSWKQGKAASEASEHRIDESAAGAAVEAYADRLSDAEPELLTRVRLDAEARWPNAAHMVSGQNQGRLLSMLCKLGHAKRVLEFGTFCGYGSLWLASSLPADGIVVTVEKDVGAATIAKAHFTAARTEHPEWASITLLETDRNDLFHSCEAQALLNEPFDVVYLDADKKGYSAMFDLLMDRNLVRSGSLIIADNTLWKGRVLGVEGAGAPMSDEAAEALILAAVENARSRALEQGLDSDAADEAGKAAKKQAKADRRDRALQQAMHEFNLKLRKDRRVEQLVLPLRDGITIARVV
ncbi:O-methyltransferase-domain-containing protein [Pelagophyceae sp. CCMP2097]|nr:O-methyltransferase-domain-containing protein [Pelagophyceae sp. CCMP2097]